MKFRIKNILASLALASGFLYVAALDLPVKRVGGTDYYFYNVERNENLAEVAKKIGVTPEDIIRFNPSASDGVHFAQILYLPVYEFPENNTSLPGQSSNAAGPDEPTRYKVQKGETLYGVSRRFDVSPDDIVALNPSAAAGVKAGQMLLIPHAGKQPESPSVPESNIPATVPRVIPPEQETTLTLAESDEPLQTAPVEEEWEMPLPERRLNPVELGTPVLFDSISSDSLIDAEIDPSTIALILPLMLESDNESKQARTAAEFTRGFMLGLSSVNDYQYQVDVRVYDSYADETRLEQILNYPAVKAASVVIAQEESSAKFSFPSFENDDAHYFLNLFATHDSTYISNPEVIQANTPANIMYEKAANAILTTYPDYTPVFLVAKGGRGEKLPFTNFLQDKYRRENIEPVELIYEGMLTFADVENLYNKEENSHLSSKYIFIPASGALSEFNKFANALLALREQIDDPSSVALFGYPDWITFRREPLEMLHRLGAMIYSRFYFDENSSGAKSFIKNFTDTYGSAPQEQVPLQAALGYDTARFILSDIEDNQGVFSPVQFHPFTGIQSSFLFSRVFPDENENDTNGGFMNTSVYIIKFRPDSTVDVTVL